MFVASRIAERLGESDRLQEMILERRNMFRALKPVRANKGAPGVDKINVNQIGGYLKRHWLKIKEDLYQKPEGRRKGKGEYHGVSNGETQTQGKRGEKRGQPTMAP